MWNPNSHAKIPKKGDISLLETMCKKTQFRHCLNFYQLYSVL